MLLNAVTNIAAEVFFAIANCAFQWVSNNIIDFFGLLGNPSEAARHEEQEIHE
jgi:hypothetical protein